MANLQSFLFIIMEEAESSGQKCHMSDAGHNISLEGLNIWSRSVQKSRLSLFALSAAKAGLQTVASSDSVGVLLKG